MSRTKIVIFALLSLVYSDLLFSQAPNYAGSYEVIRKAQQSQFEYQKLGITTADSLRDFDIIIYKLKLTLNDHLIQGSSEIGLKSEVNNLSVISLNYIEGTIDSIKSSGNLLNYNRVSGILNVTLPHPINNGDSAGLQIYYHTSPSKGFYWQTNAYNDAIWFSFAKPFEARYWFPCYDQPWDKALCDLEINVPANMYCISNGALIGQWPGPTSDRMTFHWRENYPIATYLISLSACNYAIISDTIQISGGQLPLAYYVYHRDSIRAVNDFVNIPTMFQFYSNTFGAYGFLNEKYSISETKVFDGWGAMENQTTTSLGDMLVTGNRGYEWIYAHELAHQWFGDLLTVIDWRNVWLSEGMATYLDALFTENLYGETAFRDRLGSFKSSYLWEDRNDLRYAIFNPPEDHLFGAVEYEKAALVLHMLRFVCGDEIFFQAMRRYVAAFKYGNVSTDNFKSIFESVSGQNLDWFFNEWIYSAGHPNYKVGWTVQPFINDYNFQIQIKQIQTNAPFFRMPLPVLIQSALKDTLITLDIPAQYDYHASVLLGFNPTNIIVDPENWVLKELAIANPPDYVSDLYLFSSILQKRQALSLIDTSSLMLGNAGSVDLIYTASANAGWLALPDSSNRIHPGEIDSLLIVFNTNGLAGGIYNDTITIESNDPNQPIAGIAVILTVLGSPYLPGDANGSGRIEGADVIYTVRYLKGIGPPPNPFLAGDANGDCRVAGSDVTYVVRYLKGIGPAPIGGNCR